MPKIVVKTDASLTIDSSQKLCIRLSLSSSNLLYLTGTGELSMYEGLVFEKNYYPINSISGSPSVAIGNISCSSAVSRLISVGNTDGDIFNTGATGDPNTEGVNTANLINAIAGTDVGISWWTKEDYQKTTNMGVTPNA